MAYEDPNAPSQPQTSDPVAPAAATATAATPEKKSGSWDWLLPSIVAVIIVKVFGLVGGLVSLSASTDASSRGRLSTARKKLKYGDVIGVLLRTGSARRS